MEPFYFGPAGGRRLFGVFHEPPASRRRGCGVVLCYPLGTEYTSYYRAYRQLALSLAENGFHVLRFDFRGCGDSEGEEHGASRVSDATAPAARFFVPPLWRAASSAQPAGPAAPRAMRLSSFGDGGRDFPGHPPAAAHLVSGHVVGDQPEKRGEPSGTAKHFGSGKLPYRLGAAAQAAARDGAAWPRERLSGRVEIDETYVGGEEEGLRGRQTPPRKTVRG